jgi:hypothetical protein
MATCLFQVGFGTYYDQGGNLLKLKRHDAAGTIIDSMRYFYSLNSQGKLINNRLNSVQDTGSTAAGMPMGRSFYTYDRDGRLARDVRGALNLRWTMDNKLRQAQNGSRFVRYWYDASGQRVMKRLHGDTAEYIIRDGTGNELLRTTRRNNSTASPVLVRTEANVYGASRIGVHELPMPTTPPQPDTMETRASSRYNYEITDHLGNVRVTVGDVKTFVVSSPGYRLDALVRSANDMYPYGMPMSTRTFAAPSFYRFGFNTQEKSIELNSGGNLTTALFWEYDSRTGRRWNLDPKPQISISDYGVNGLNPIIMFDPMGDKFKISTKDKKAQEDVNSIVKSRNRKFIKIDPQTGEVSLDFKGLSDKKIQRRLRKDKGLSTISELSTAKKADGSDYNFFYGTEGATGIVPENPQVQGNLNNYFVNISDLNTKNSPNSEGFYDARGFALNASIQPFSNKSSGKTKDDYGLKPGDNYDGKTFIGRGTFFSIQNIFKPAANQDPSKPGLTMVSVPTMVEVSRAGIVIHELREVLLRTVYGKSYSEAHDQSGGFSDFHGGGYKP